MILPYNAHEYYLKNKKAILKKQNEYYLKNKKAILPKQKEYREKNPKRTKLAQKKSQAKHPEKYRASRRNWLRKNPDKTQRYHQTYRSKPGIREKELAKSKKYNQEHQEERRQYAQKPEVKRYRIKYHRDNRIDCLKIYSKKISNSSEPICSSCGLKDVRFLQIDHINGVTVDDGRGASNLVGYLRRNNYPGGYQVLCGNCNWLKEFEDKKKTLSTKKENVKRREEYQELKKEVFTHYSKGKPKCNCCGFDNFTALSIDHISGRKEVGHRKTDTSRLVYYWLRRNHYPKDFQVLCVMCNQAKRNLEKCPHQKQN